MKGISFNKLMFYATIEGRKTQTRRIMKPQPVYDIDGYPIADWDLLCKPRYKVGETVYIKEPYRYCSVHNICYIWANECSRTYCDRGTKINLGAITMPAKYARFFIEITDVRCERLQDITDSDCVKEGILINDAYDNNVRDKKIFVSSSCYIVKFAEHIDSIYGKKTWESNPYVWVYTYKLKTKTFDEILEDNKDVLMRLKNK